MTRTTLACLALALALAALLPACRRAETSGPPSIQLGSDECGACGMLVMEDRCSCALLIEEEGHRSHLVFDDLGCLLDYRTDHPESVVVAAFVHDYGTGEWVAGADAHYIFGVSDTVITPMASGIIAFATVDGAGQRQATSGGEVTDYDRLNKLRSAWRDARRQPAGTP